MRMEQTSWHHPLVTVPSVHGLFLNIWWWWTLYWAGTGNLKPPTTWLTCDQCDPTESQTQTQCNCNHPINFAMKRHETTFNGTPRRNKSTTKGSAEVPRMFQGKCSDPNTATQAPQNAAPHWKSSPPSLDPWWSGSPSQGKINKCTIIMHNSAFDGCKSFVFHSIWWCHPFPACFSSSKVCRKRWTYRITSRKGEAPSLCLNPLRQTWPLLLFHVVRHVGSPRRGLDLWWLSKKQSQAHPANKPNDKPSTITIIIVAIIIHYHYCWDSDWVCHIWVVKFIKPNI